MTVINLDVTPSIQEWQTLSVVASQLNIDAFG